MREIKLKVYSFSELSEKAKEVAIQEVRESQDFSHIYGDAEATIKAFCDIFNNFSVKTHHRDMFTPVCDVPDNILNLSGQRLKTYIYNNYELHKGKYYGKLVDTEKDGTKIEKSKKHPAGLRHVKRYSKIQKDNCCILTGVCYDNDMLSVFYDFLDGKKYQNYDLEDLIKASFSNLEASINSEIEYWQSDEGITEDLQDRDTEYFEDGTRV